MSGELDVLGSPLVWYSRARCGGGGGSKGWEEWTGNKVGGQERHGGLDVVREEERSR